MAWTTAQLAQGANYTLESFSTKDPVDQINVAHRTLDLFVTNKQVSFFGNGIFNEKLFISNDSNYQNYEGADQVTYNERDPNRFAKFQYYSNHEGFWFDEDRLIRNGILIDDSGVAVPSSQEKEQLVNLLQSSWTAMKNGLQEGLALETLQNGSQSAKAVPGLDHIVSTTPGTGDIVGGINASTSTYWRNNASMAIASGGVVAALDAMYDACVRYGGAIPTDIRCGQAFLNAYKAEAKIEINRQIIVGANGGIREGSKVFANPSGTSSRDALIGQLATTGAGAGTALAMGNAGAAFITLASSLGSSAFANGLAKAMTSPKYVNWLARTSEKPTGEIMSQLQVLRGIAERSRDPDVAEVADEIERQLSEQTTE